MLTMVPANVTECPPRAVSAWPSPGFGEGRVTLPTDNLDQQAGSSPGLVRPHWPRPPAPGAHIVTTPQTPPSSHQAKRRRVLRGAVAAPVVLTISSGAGATMTSNMRCVNNQANNPAHGVRSVAVSTSTTSTTIRVPLYLTGGKRYIRGSDIVALQHPSRPVTWISTGQWWEFNASTNQRIGSSAVLLPSTPPLTSPVQYVVLQMDQHGQIVGAGAHSTSSSMVHGTCWTSFVAGAVPPL
jgi:hypothetical protein